MMIESKRIEMNNRFKYTITPGSDIYFVYNHNWVDDSENIRHHLC